LTKSSPYGIINLMKEVGFKISSLINAPFNPVTRDDLKGKGTIELRAEILNQRMLDTYYAELRADNFDEFRRIKRAN